MIVLFGFSRQASRPVPYGAQQSDKHRILHSQAHTATRGPDGDRARVTNTSNRTKPLHRQSHGGTRQCLRYRNECTLGQNFQAALHQQASAPNVSEKSHDGKGRRGGETGLRDLRYCGGWCRERTSFTRNHSRGREIFDDTVSFNASDHIP